MRGDQPVGARRPRPSAAPRRYLNTSMSRFGGALPPVGVLEPHDVVELRRRDLDDERVLERRTRWTVPGRKRNAAPARSRPRSRSRRRGGRARARRAPPGRTTTRPSRWWNWRHSDSPGRDEQDLAAVASVSAQISSQPHGFSTRRGSKAQARVHARQPAAGFARDVLLGAAQVLGRVHGEPEAVVPERGEPSVGGELGKRRRLVVAALGQRARSPRRRARRRRSSPSTAASGPRETRRPSRRPSSVDDAERRRQRRDRDRRGRRALAVQREQRLEVDVEELVAVQREDAPDSRRARAAKRRPPPRPSGSGSSTTDELEAGAGELALEQSLHARRRQPRSRGRRPRRASAATW